MRDLLADKAFVESLDGVGTSFLVETIAVHAIDRAMVAEKQRDELQKRAEELERFMRLIVNTTAHPISETYSLSGHMNAVEYAKHMLKETQNETSE